MLKTGVYLGKRYEIIERVGAGGMADVYKGKDHKLNRYVAIKVLKSDFRADEEFIRKFHSEAQAAAGLMHPNVVNVYDVGEDRGLHYMVMELVEGITLKEYIEKKRRLSAKETISIAIQMATGIEAAHNQHIIHRDIKPANIIISKEGKVKVTDFGIARATNSANTISSNVMGSVHYTSPEQARGGAVDIKSDIYSAGITMYEMVTGHVPFDGDSTVSIAIKHLQEEIKSPAEEVPDIPYSLECIILKCTQKSPELRYANAAELIMDLKRSLVDPEGNFVVLGASGRNNSSTVVITPDELERIQRNAAYNEDDDYDEDDYDEDEYSDDDEDEYDEDYNDSEEGQSEDVNPKMAKVMKILMIVAAVIIAFALIFAAANAAGLFKSIKGSAITNTESKVSVPDLVGMTEEEAQTALNDKELGFKVSERKESDKYDKGVVMEQKTAANKKVAKNTQISIVVSTGKSTAEVSVPDVTRQDEATAQKALEDAKLIVSQDTDYDDDIAAGKVISTDPVAGTTVKEGSKVTMTVSLGAKTAKVSIPDVAGQDEATAQKVLENAKLIVSSTAVYDDNIEVGKVISTDPAAGTTVKEGSKVTMTVSQGADKVSVPSLKGMSQDAASSALSAAGLVTGSISQDYSDSVASGMVISQGTTSGTKVTRGTAVNFVVSLGAETNKVTVPMLSGMTQEDAASALSGLGLTGTVTEENSSTVTVGYVISQTITPGSQVDEGSNVGYTVSVGP